MKDAQLIREEAYIKAALSNKEISEQDAEEMLKEARANCEQRLKTVH
jgi:predicted TIM-barrel enzyme